MRMSPVPTVNPLLPVGGAGCVRAAPPPVRVREIEPDRVTAEAYAFCERLARAHYENFPIGSRFLPPPPMCHSIGLRMRMPSRKTG